MSQSTEIDKLSNKEKLNLLKTRLSMKSLNMTGEEYKVLREEIYNGDWPGTPRESEIQRARDIVNKRKSKSQEERIKALEKKYEELFKFVRDMCDELFESESETDRSENEESEGEKEE